MGKHHNTLGVANTATPDEIKKAYRKLCMVYHPDKGGNADTFLRINEAYNSLTTVVQVKPPVFHKPKPQFSEYENAYVKCIGSFLTSKGDVDLHFILTDMYSARIWKEDVLVFNHYLYNKSTISLLIPKKILVDCKYTFTVQFNSMGIPGKTINYHFKFNDPRSKWEKFWYKLFN